MKDDSNEGGGVYYVAVTFEGVLGNLRRNGLGISKGSRVEPPSMRSLRESHLANQCCTFDQGCANKLLKPTPGRAHRRCAVTSLAGAA